MICGLKRPSIVRRNSPSKKQKKTKAKPKRYTWYTVFSRSVCEDLKVKVGKDMNEELRRRKDLLTAAEIRHYKQIARELSAQEKLKYPGHPKNDVAHFMSSPPVSSSPASLPFPRTPETKLPVYPISVVPRVTHVAIKPVGKHRVPPRQSPHFGSAPGTPPSEAPLPPYHLTPLPPRQPPISSQEHHPKTQDIKFLTKWEQLVRLADEIKSETERDVGIMSFDPVKGHTGFYGTGSLAELPIYRPSVILDVKSFCESKNTGTLSLTKSGF